MKPQNSKERRSSFYKFLILFLVTTGSVVGAVYFNVKVPNKENDLLREQAEIMDNDSQFQKTFFVEMKEIVGMIDSLDKSGTNVEFEASQISRRLGALAETIPPKDSINNSDMNEEIIQLLLVLKNDKMRLHELRNSEDEITVLRQSLQNCDQALTNARTTISILQNN